MKTKQIDVAKHYGLHKSRVCEIKRDKPELYMEMEVKTKAGFDLEYGKQLAELAGLVYLYNLQNPALSGYASLAVGSIYVLTITDGGSIKQISQPECEITEAINFMRGKCYGVSSVD